MWLVSGLLFVAVLAHFQTYFTKVETFGDNPAYIGAAKAIQHWDFRNATVQQFCGVSYLMAGVSLAHLSASASRLVICVATSLASVLLTLAPLGTVGRRFFRRAKPRLVRSLFSRRSRAAVHDTPVVLVLGRRQRALGHSFSLGRPGLPLFTPSGSSRSWELGWYCSIAMNSRKYSWARRSPPFSERYTLRHLPSTFTIPCISCTNTKRKTGSLSRRSAGPSALWS